jgi:hypothetical protein
MIYSKIYDFFTGLKRRVVLSGSELVGSWANRIYLLALALLQVTAWWSAHFIYKNLVGGLLVLHYNIDFGIDWVGDPNNIFYFPSLGLLFILVSFIFLLFSAPGRNFRFQSQLALAGAVFLNILVIIALGSVYLINFR